MNKGMIMEVKKKYAIALNDEGIMDIILSKQNMAVGQKIFYFEEDIVKQTVSKAKKYNNFIKAFGSIAALFLLVFTFFNTMNYEQAYAVVSLDINPSIQIEADSNQQIIKVEGVNIDGKNIDFSDIKDISLDAGIDKIKEKLVEKNYLDTNREVLVSLAFMEDGDNTAYAVNITDAIKSTFHTETVTYVKGDKEGVDEAKAKGISLGRYEASLVVDEETKKTIDKAPVKDITSSIIDKKNVTQWEAKDEIVKDVPVTNTNPEVTNEKPVTNTNTTTTTTTTTTKPIINVPSENAESSIDEETKIDNSTKLNDNPVLVLEPEVPVETKKDEDTKLPVDNSIPIVPNNGTIENNTTSGKIQEYTKPAEISPEPDQDLVNKNTKN